MQRIDKYLQYLRVVQWAQKRYTKNGALILQKGNTPSKYSRIEEAAFQKYLRTNK